MYRVLRPFLLSSDGVTSQLVVVGQVVEVGVRLAPGLLAEGWIASTEAPERPVEAPKRPAKAR